MASNVGEDNSQVFGNSDEGKSFKVTGGYLRPSTGKVGRKLACKFGDTVRKSFETEVKRLGGLASSCHTGKNTGLEGAAENEPQLVMTLSSKGLPGHNEFVPQEMDKGNLDSVKSIDSLKAQLREGHLFYEAKITNLEREKEKEAKNFKQKLFHGEKEKNAWRKRCQQLEATNDKLNSELQEKNKELSDLQEQLKDLMYHLEKQEAIANAPGEKRQELQDGNIFLAKPGPSLRSHQPKKTGRRRGRRP